MNFKKSTLIFLVFALLISLAGCAKKPRRPNPLDTVTSAGQGGQQNSGFDPFGADGDFVSDTDALAQRDETRSLEDAERNLLPSIYFDTNSASIKPSERNKLTQAADFVRNNPGSSLVLVGYCDWRGTPEYNLALGDRRSKSASRYLETLGIGSDKIEMLSKGDLEAVEGASAAQMAKDRRVEVNVFR